MRHLKNCNYDKFIEYSSLVRDHKEHFCTEFNIKDIYQSIKTRQGITE